ncbi:MAG: UMP kinase [Pseudomonadota bacterium]
MMENTTTRPIYQRILLKLSGEALQGDHLFGINANKLTRISQEVASVVQAGVQVGLVIGGGNLIRGAELCATGIDRVTADQMGMLATVINGLALLDAFERQGVSATIMSAIAVPGLVEFYDRRKAREELEKGKVVVFVAGTGNPLVTTDSAAALRGIEIGADIVMKATKVDGVFAADPIKNPKAERYEKLLYDEVLEQRLGVMDLNAILLCREHNLPIRVFNMNKQGSLARIVVGENIGTLIQSGD